jgi:hypothetical protein
MAVISTERDRLRWAQHREVQAGEESNETITATRADVA